jgi:hypothetical protein
MPQEKILIPEFLIELSKKLNTQDERATNLPQFVVQEDVEVEHGGPNYWEADVKRRRTTEGMGSGKDYYEALLCYECTKEFESDTAFDDLPVDCEKCDEGLFVFVDIKQEFKMEAGAFLTAEACDKHIRLNKHHYSNPRSFAVSSWRNPEMEQLINWIKSLTK